MVELKRHYDSIMKNTASLKKHRAVASTDANKIGYQKRSELRSQYGNWRAINQSINVVGNVTEGVGDVLALGSIANPGFAAPATGFSLAGKYIKVLNVGTEMKAASYYDKLLDSSSYDRKKLSDAYAYVFLIAAGIVFLGALLTLFMKIKHERTDVVVHVE
jgi:hypothetical protein